MGYDAVNATFYGLPTIATRNRYEIALANFMVLNGANRLMRTGGVTAGGTVESGSLKYEKTVTTNVTLDTNTGKYFVSKLPARH